MLFGLVDLRAGMGCEREIYIGLCGMVGCAGFRVLV